jgi:hypothetical protein
MKSSLPRSEREFGVIGGQPYIAGAATLAVGQIEVANRTAEVLVSLVAAARPVCEGLCDCVYCLLGNLEFGSPARTKFMNFEHALGRPQLAVDRSAGLSQKWLKDWRAHLFMQLPY